jgi:CRISPR-associated endonuclease/helicase Cas3
LDTLVQTSPRPVPEPAVSFFLHGCEPTDVDVQVVIRSDLSQDIDQWAGIAKLCPPTSAEALPVRLWIFREWMAGEKSPPVDADTEGAIKHAPSRSEDETHVVLWNDGEPELVWSPAKIYPGAMVIIPASSRVDALGYIPADAVNDIADAAFLETKRRVQLRLHPAFELLPAKLADLAKLTDIDPGDLKAKAEVCLEASALPAWLSEPLQVIAKAKSIDIERYPDNSGFVVRTRRRHRPDDSWEEDGAADERSGGEEVLLTDHTQHVVEATERNANALVDDDHAQTLFRAAELHDAGKAHLDFQIFLRRGDKLTAAFAPPIAKGTSRGGPSPFRHEMLSTIHAALRTPNGADRDLLLHLIASHHGRCRPFAPVEADAAARFTFDGFTVSAAECAEHAPHRLCNGAAERFWRLTRLYGWWGLAYLEAMLRLGDWEASASEQERTDA